MALAHAGVAVPLLSALGPEGGRVVLPAAGAFAVAAVVWAAVAVGAARRRPWAWALGLVVAGLTVLGAATPFRGAGSAVGIVLGAGVIAVLLSRPGRRELLGR